MRALSVSQALCYFDFTSYETVYDLIDELAPAPDYLPAAFVTDVCGGLYVDNYSESSSSAEQNIYDLYIAVQVWVVLLSSHPLLMMLLLLLLFRTQGHNQQGA